MIGTTPVAGGYLKIEALKMELRTVEKELSQSEGESTHPQCLTAPIPTLDCRIAVS